MPATRRKLTTIFSADVQGYSRLMEADEEGTLATLRTHRDAMASLIEGHAGRVVNTWGDGLIAEFASVVEAVRAAVDVQSELAHRNEALPDQARMRFRIGINLGDVIEEGADIYGDGVNIAARLQASAPPGGIVISNTVYDQVRNKVAVGFEFLGQLSVKNIDQAVPSYVVRIGVAEDDEKVPERAGAEPPRPRRSAAAVAWYRRIYAIIALAAAFFVVVNLITYSGELWSAWTLVVAAGIAGLVWTRQTTRVEPTIATMLVVGLFLVGLNVLGWHGTFWAVWPLLGMAVALGIRFVFRIGASRNSAS